MFVRSGKVDFLRKGSRVSVFLLLYLAASVAFIYLRGLQYPLYHLCDDLTAELDFHEYSFVLVVTSFTVLVLSRLLLAAILRPKKVCKIHTVTIWIVAEMLASVAAVWGVDMLLFTGVTFYPGQLFVQVTVDIIKLYVFPMAIVSLSMLCDQFRRDISTLRQPDNTKSNTVPKQSSSPHTEMPTAPNPVLNKLPYPTVEDIFSEMVCFYDRTNDFDFSLPLKDVLFVETSDNYVSVNYLDEGHVSSRIIRNTMKNMEEYLHSYGFFRCHRQYLVNAHNIKSISKGKEGLIIRLRGSNTVIPVSKTYSSAIIPVQPSVPDNPQ